MANVTIAFGLILIVLGVCAYLGTGKTSVTALIPAFFGIPLAVLGFVARDDRNRKHAMHAAAALALLGFLGTLRGIAGAVALASGKTVARPAAAVVQTIMAVLCAIFLALAIRSFIHARRNRSS